MHKLLLVATVVLLLNTAHAQTPVEAKMGNVQVGDPVPEFSADLIDLSGDGERIEHYDSKAAHPVTAFVMVGTHCPSTAAYSERLSQLSAAYQGKVDFIYVYPNREDSREMKLAFHKDKKLGGRLIDDQNARLARLFGAQRTTEVYIADQAHKVVYRGAVDDLRDNPEAVKQKYVATALDQTLAGQPVTTTQSQVFA